MMKPKVSVVLPTYNEEDSVETAVQSLLNQTYDNMEVLVVDDESTDNTQNIIRSIDDARVKLLVRDEGEKGLTPALNFGIEQSDGKYVARQDADDKSDPQRIEKQVQKAEEKNLDIVGTGSYNIDKSGSVISRRDVPEEPDPTQFNSGSQFIHGSLIMRGDMLSDLDGYNTAYETSEDVELLCRAVNSGYGFENINKPLYYFTVDEDSKYRSDVRRSTLYGFYAVNKDRFEIDPNEFADLRDEDLADYMSDRELRMFYREMAQENLRFGRKLNSRYYSVKGMPSLRLFALLLLSFVPMIVIRWIVSVYRRLPMD